VKVIARSSSFKFKGKETDLQEVADALGVQAIVMGRIMQNGGNFLINVELVNAHDKTHQLLLTIIFEVCFSFLNNLF